MLQTIDLSTFLCLSLLKNKKKHTYTVHTRAVSRWVMEGCGSGGEGRSVLIIMITACVSPSLFACDVKKLSHLLVSEGEAV